MAKRKPKPLDAEVAPSAAEAESGSFSHPITPPASEGAKSPDHSPSPSDSGPPDSTSTAAPFESRFAEKSPAEPKVHDGGIRSDFLAGVRLLEDRRFKQIQLAFQEKPSDAVRQVVRDAGYQWRSLQQVWTKQIDPDKAWQTRAQADELFNTVSDMLRAEKGIGIEVS